MKDDSGSYAGFTEQGSSASQMTHPNLWISSPDCRVAMDMQQTQHRPSENGRCSQIIENSKIGVSRHLDSSTTTQMA